MLMIQELVAQKTYTLDNEHFEPENHPFEKENHLNQTFIFGCILRSEWIC